MKLVKDHGAFIAKAYNEGASTYEIAEQIGTYANAVRRALKHMGIPLKSRSEAQKNALDAGRHNHPTKGRKRSEEERIKISESVATYWENLPDEVREERVLQAKERWDAMSEDEKEALRKAAGEGIRRASKEGSALEKFLVDSLQEAGYDVIFHKKGLLAQVDLEIDIYLPALKIAIEVDGPSHFLPIWGTENLNRHIQADAKKAGLLLNSGMCIIRIKHMNKNTSQKTQRDISKQLISLVEKIDKKFPDKHKRYIELELE